MLPNKFLPFGLVIGEERPNCDTQLGEHLLNPPDRRLSLHTYPNAPKLTVASYSLCERANPGPAGIQQNPNPMLTELTGEECATFFRHE